MCAAMAEECYRQQAAEHAARVATCRLLAGRDRGKRPPVTCLLDREGFVLP